jgi:enoyl-[acyl-carrier-protein] reductase (NADH)
VSAYSLAPLCRYAKPLFNEGGSVITLSYLGAERAIPNYNVMGVAKAALEASVRYLAAELGPQKQVRVNAISAGPIRTLASSAIGGILDMIHNVEAKAPLQRTVTQEEVGSTAAFLASPLASGITGQVMYVDAGYCITGHVRAQPRRCRARQAGENRKPSARAMATTALPSAAASTRCWMAGVDSALARKVISCAFDIEPADKFA